jgi:hypothetical protein
MAFTRRGVSALQGPVKGSKILWPDPLAEESLTLIDRQHGQSILEVLRTKPLTAPAPSSDRRLSGEVLHLEEPLA